MKAHIQGVVTYEGKRRRDLRPDINDIYGNMKSFTEVDLGAGVEKGPWSVDLYVKNLFDVRGQLSKGIQCREEICGDPFDDHHIRRQGLYGRQPTANDRASHRAQILAAHRSRHGARRDMIAAGFILLLSFPSPNGEGAA